MACELLELLSASHLSIGTLIHLNLGSHICLTDGYLLSHIPSLLLLIFDTWSSYVAQVGLILLPQLPVLLDCSSCAMTLNLKNCFLEALFFFFMEGV